MAERPGVLRVNDRVVFSGATHTVVAISGATIRLLSAAGATTVVALPFLLAAADFELVGATPAPRVDPHGLLEALPAQALQVARDWERHLTNTPEIITAHRRHGRLLATTGDRDWTYQQLHRASWIVREWARRSYRSVPRLHERWQARGQLLDGLHSPFNPSDLLVYPEAVALTEIFCDLEWRRHVAMVRELQMRLRRGGGYDWVSNPIQQWISQLRHTHQKIRAEFYERHNGFSRTPFPEIRHFK